MKKNFKSALAFFFLFFLHGFSIGNGQQGISYNIHIHAILIIQYFIYLSNDIQEAYKKGNNRKKIS